MRENRHHWRWLAGCLLILAAAAGCYQQTGVEPQPLAAVELGPSITPLPSETPFPTPEPATDTPEPEPTDLLGEPQVAPTEDPLGLLQAPTDDPFGLLQAPTEDPFAAPFPTSDLLGSAPELPTTDPFLFGATATPDLFGGIAQVPTSELEGLFGQQEQEIDPIFASATAIIEGATATEAFFQTATAVGLGFGIPTETPTATATTFVAGQQPVLSGTDCVHEVRAGENLFRISLNYGLTLQQVASYNNIINPSVILVGQRVTIPGCGTTGQLPLPTSTPQPGETPGVPPTSGGTNVCGPSYTVQQGDTLFKISLRCGVPVMSIAAANGIQNINLILINQTLNIPPS